MNIDESGRVHIARGAMLRPIAVCDRLHDVRANLLGEHQVSWDLYERDLTELVAEFSAKGLLFVENAAESPASPFDVV